MAPEHERPLRLNLGGGTHKIDGWLCVDLHAPDPDLRLDLFKFPWPWKDSSVDAVAMIHFLEHVQELERTIMEVHRILRPGGTFWVVVPHAKNPGAYAVDHRYFFMSSTFHQIAGTQYFHWGGRRLFETRSFKMPLVQWKWITWTPFDWITARWPTAFEKFVPIAPAWIDWVGVKV